MGELKFDEGGLFLEARMETKDGSTTVVRPARVDDRDRVERMFRSCSAETLYTRFLSPGLGVPLRYLDRLMRHAPPEANALVAEVVEDGETKLAALLNLIETDPGRTGELAILVLDPYQNRGLGTAMIDCTIKIAKRRGISSLVADIDAGNRRVFHLIKRSGLPSTVQIDQGIAHVEMKVE